MPQPTIELLLAYRPFLDPMDLHDQWLWLLIPLVVAISLVYKTLKLQSLEKLAADTTRLTLTILAVTAVAAAACWGLTEVM